MNFLQIHSKLCNWFVFRTWFEKKYRKRQSKFQIKKICLEHVKKCMFIPSICLRNGTTVLSSWWAYVSVVVARIPIALKKIKYYAKEITPKILKCGRMHSTRWDYCANSNVLQPVVRRNSHDALQSVCVLPKWNSCFQLFDLYMKICASYWADVFTLTEKDQRTMQSITSPNCCLLTIVISKSNLPKILKTKIDAGQIVN